ncbi:hypothetical protein B0H19DRAFT_1148128 [Mycena capillaripes]|nr:hypothetical protein B0H19DRAFT_1148128 [Mycena capillaripes]
MTQTIRPLPSKQSNATSTSSASRAFNRCMCASCTTRSKTSSTSSRATYEELDCRAASVRDSSISSKISSRNMYSPSMTRCVRFGSSAGESARTVSACSNLSVIAVGRVPPSTMKQSRDGDEANICISSSMRREDFLRMMVFREHCDRCTNAPRFPGCRNAIISSVSSEGAVKCWKKLGGARMEPLKSTFQERRWGNVASPFDPAWKDTCP